MKKVALCSASLLLLTSCAGLFKSEDVTNKLIIQRDWIGTTALVRFTNSTDYCLCVYVEGALERTNFPPRAYFNKEFRCVRHPVMKEVTVRATADSGTEIVQTFPLVLPPDNPPFAGPVIVCVIK